MQTQFCKSTECGFSGQPKMAFHHLILSYRSWGRLGGHCEDVSRGFSSIPSLSLGGQNYPWTSEQPNPVVLFCLHQAYTTADSDNCSFAHASVFLSTLSITLTYFPSPLVVPPHCPLPASSSSAQTLNTECPQINPQASHSFLFPWSVQEPWLVLS